MRSGQILLDSSEILDIHCCFECFPFPHLVIELAKGFILLAPVTGHNCKVVLLRARKLIPPLWVEVLAQFFSLRIEIQNKSSVGVFESEGFLRETGKCSLNCSGARRTNKCVREDPQEKPSL